MAGYSGGFYGDQSSLEKKLADLAGLIYDAVNPPVEVITANRT